MGNIHLRDVKNIFKLSIRRICLFMRVLVVDDDKKFCEVIKRGLTENAYAVDCVHNGDDGYYYVENGAYDLVILDIMMPKCDGMTMCRNLRKHNIMTPILFLTAKDTVEDRVQGLDIGADDYIVKPFAFPELLARMRAILRRDGVSDKLPEIQMGELVLNTVTHEVFYKDKAVHLTSKEFTILKYMMHHPNAVITRTMIEEHAWNYDFDNMSNIVDVYIKRIRQKIDPEHGKNIIQTIRGSGYRIKKP